MHLIHYLLYHYNLSISIYVASRAIEEIEKIVHSNEYQQRKATGHP